MPYYVYRITAGPTALIKQLDLVQEFDNFKTAKEFAKQQRASQAADDASTIKVIFADNALAAEEQLMEQREAPILREWEK